MTKRCYILMHSSAVETAIRKLSYTVPCFLDRSELCAGYFELAVTCRREDVAAVERRLAPYVQGAGAIRRMTSKLVEKKGLTFE